jgi:hypothetical protein
VSEDREELVQPEPGEVIAGEDDLPRQPAPPLDPYTPEPAARPSTVRAWGVMRIAWIPVLVGFAIVVFALVR